MRGRFLKFFDDLLPSSTSTLDDEILPKSGRDDLLPKSGSASTQYSNSPVSATRTLSEPEVSLDFEDGSISVISLDCDGCILQRGMMSDEEIILRNEKLIDHICKVSARASEIILFSGSNRQSHFMDQMNSVQNGNGSSFKAMQVIVQEINKRFGKNICRFEPLLLADIYNDLPAGEALRALNECNADPYHISNGLVDYDLIVKHSDRFMNHIPRNEDKNFLVYGQVHHTNSILDLPSKKIYFHFYDDVHHIHGSLFNCFSVHRPDLLPVNVKLHMWLYSGSEVEIFKDTIYGKGIVMGTGKVDYSYAKTIKNSSLKCAHFTDEYETTGETVEEAFKNKNFRALIIGTTNRGENENYPIPEATEANESTQVILTEAPVNTNTDELSDALSGLSLDLNRSNVDQTNNVSLAFMPVSQQQEPRPTSERQNTGAEKAAIHTL